MTRIVLLNGPPRSGKNTGAMLLDDDCPVPSAVIGFSTHLKVMVHTIYLGRPGALMNPECFDAVKGEPQEILGGKSWRWAYIHYSEHVIKPLHGKEWFGDRFCDAVRASMAAYVFVPDSGFVEEAERTVREFGAQNCVLVRLHRRGCDFTGDSRRYIDLTHVGVRSLDVMNDGTPEELRNSLTGAVRLFERAAA